MIDCLVWTGACNESGYGVRKLNGKVGRVHRQTWEASNGPIPAGLFVCHSCDNPPCYNLAHLFLGTNSDNVADAVRKGRMAKGSSNASAKLTEEAVVLIRQRYKAGGIRQRDLAAEYGVTRPTISRALSNAWQHVEAVPNA